MMAFRKIKSKLHATFVLIIFCKILILSGCGDNLEILEDGQVINMDTDEVIEIDEINDVAELMKNDIMIMLQKFFDGFDNRDYEVLKEVFHPNAYIYSTYFKDGITFELWCTKYILGDNNPEGFDREVLLLDITGDTAIAKVEWRRASRTYTDYYTLFLRNGSWRITQKIFNLKFDR